MSFKSVASLGKAARPECHHFGVTPFGETQYYDEKPTICGEYLSFYTLFGPNPHLELDRKPTDFAAKTFFFLFYIFCSSHTFEPKTHLFCSEDLFFVFTYFWTEKGRHHEIPLRVPPSLATPLIQMAISEKLTPRPSVCNMLEIKVQFKLLHLAVRPV